MCGIAGAGKTNYAQRLEAEGYVRISIDEEVWSRHGRFGVDYDPVLYDEYSAAAEAALRSQLRDLLRRGRNVVIDFSFWDRARRDEYKQLIVELGGTWELVYLKASRAELKRRLATRGNRFDANASFPIDDALLDRYIAAFQEPSGEGETVITDLPA